MGLLSDLLGSQPSADGLSPDQVAYLLAQQQAGDAAPQAAQPSVSVGYAPTRAGSPAAQPFPGPYGLVWGADGGRDPKTGELVLAGKPMSDGAPSQALAGASGVLSGVPILGPALERGTGALSGWLHSFDPSAPVDAQQQAATVAWQRMNDAQAAYPKTAAVGGVIGSTAALGPVIAEAPALLGVGPGGLTAGKVATGALTGGTLGATDAAVRSGGDPVASIIGGGEGAGLGVLGPVIGAGVSRVGRAIGLGGRDVAMPAPPSSSNASAPVTPTKPVANLDDADLLARIKAAISAAPDAFPAAAEQTEQAARYPGIGGLPQALEPYAVSAGLSVPEFLDSFFGPRVANVAVHPEVGGTEVALNGSVVDRDGNKIGFISRTFPGDGTVNHTLFNLDEGQDAGVGKDILARHIPLYQRMGLSRVTTHANIDVGGYAWARYGFVPDQADWDQLRPGLRVQLDTLRDQLPAATYSDLRDVLASPNPKGAWEVADDKTPVNVPGRAGNLGDLPADVSDEEIEWQNYLAELRAQTAAGTPGLTPPGFKPPYSRGTEPTTLPLGKRLLLGTSWQGALDLRDPETLQRFHNYAK